MRAAFFLGKGSPLAIREVKKPKPNKDHVLIRLRNAAINHRDLWLFNEQSLPEKTEVILGSDGTGIIEEVGADIDPLLIGMEVIINPSHEWGNNAVVQGNTFKILGFPDNGTFSDYIVVPKKYVFEKPENLSFAEAAAYPLAGLTAYRALFSKARLRANEKVLITGIGGGTALCALQFAVQYKARVYVTSGSDEKIQSAIQLGASGGFNYRHDDWSAKALQQSGGFDIVIDSAGGEQFAKLPELMLPGGRIVNFGRTGGDIPTLSPRLLFWKQLSILGTTMGTRDEFLSMLDFVESRKMKPVIDTHYPLENIHEAFERMKDQKQFGKIIIDISE